MQPQTSVAVQSLSPAFHPGSEIVYYFQKSDLGDYRLRLPANETGTGYNLIADLGFGDVLPQYEPVALPVYGRLEGIKVSPTSLSTSETGTSASFFVKLDRRPTANVTISVTGNPAEGTLDKSSLTFTPANWSTPQSVKVTGQADAASGTSTGPDQASTPYRIELGAAQSTDPLYQGLRVPSVLVTNSDVPGTIKVGAAAGTTDAFIPASSSPRITTTPPSGTGTITLIVNHKPTAPISVQIDVTNTADGEIVQKGTMIPGSTTVTFDPSEFNPNDPVMKNVYLQSLTDPAKHGQPVTYTVTFKTTSTDPNFSALVPVPVTVTNNNP